MRKVVTLLTVILLLLTPINIVAAKPSLESLVNKYNNAVEEVFWWSSLSDSISRGGTIQDIALRAVEDYRSISSKEDRKYTVKKAIDDMVLLNKLAYQVNVSPKVKLVLSAAALLNHIKASSKLKAAEKELRKYYPYDAKQIIDGLSGYGGGGGSSRTW
ncbi:hypothetical protein ASJ81_13925 [Methanosarcina spelaei]|uniref:Uncharacterized protein n=1 Tax=Methanosarcina spelaei TaxID=1036679 RepID=A0A2A2HYU7_9EURY|nr:hypothetical protein [Methanosarcina spelaei]PAV14420.1 hypothetical protein ASJ81_13925 [Methanosarcina spelaei]